MADITGSRTEANLRRAFTDETIAGRRHAAAAARAEAGGNESAAVSLRQAAQRRHTHAAGHMDQLEPAPPGRGTAYLLRVAIMHEVHEFAGAYPAMARKAREEGLDDIATWFECLAKSSRARAARFRRSLETSM